MPVDFFILLPLVAVFALNLPFLRASCSIATVVTLLYGALQLIATLFPCPCMGVIPSVLNFAVTVGAHNYIFLAMIAAVVLGVAIAALNTVEEGDDRFYFMNLLLLLTGAMNGLTMVSDLFTLYIFLEVVAIASWVFIAFDRKRQGLEGAIKYLMLSAVATLFLLTGIALLLTMSGTTSLMMLQQYAIYNTHNPLVMLAFAFLIIGLSIKGGLVPFHNWTPDAYSGAPTTVSALLAGITTKITGVYTLMRLYHEVMPQIEEINKLLLALGAISILVGALAAVKQQNAKRMLAYSSISQVGYIILALGCGGELGFLAATFHFVNHALSKAQLFINVAAIEKEIGSVEMDNWIGVHEKMPVTGWTSVMAFLSVAGVPPFLGFWTKVLIVLALWKSGHPFYAAYAIALSLFTLAYFLRLQRHVFFGRWNETIQTVVADRSYALIASAIFMMLLSFWMIVPLLNSTFLVGGIL